MHRLQQQHLEHQHVVKGRAAALAAIAPRDGPLQLRPELLKVHKGGDTLEVVTLGRQLPQPIRHVEEARLPNHRRRPAHQVRIESACRPMSQRFLEASNFPAGLRSTCRHVNLEIVKRSELRNFVVLPKRWIVERTIAWLNRCRRLAKDWECLNRSALAFLRWASVRRMLRRLCQKTIRSRMDS